MWAGKGNKYLIGVLYLLHNCHFLGLTAPQVRAHLEMNGPNTIAQSLKVPEWVRFSKCLFGGCSLFLWGGALLSFVDYSIMCGTVSTLHQLDLKISEIIKLET